MPATGAVALDRREPMVYESYAAARDTIGGRIPGGQTSLFQGLWTDPVTGIAYARARWYDARNATWLSEDPLEDAESPNLYAFVGWQPHQRIDPLGERSLGDDSLGSLAGAVATGVAEGALDLVAAPIISAKRFVKDPEKWADSAIDGALNFLEHGNEIPAMLFDQLVDSDNRLEMLAYAGTQAALPAAGGKALSGLSRHKAPKGSGKAGQAAARLPSSTRAADEAVHATQAAKLTDGSRRMPSVAKRADADAGTQPRAQSRSTSSNNPGESPACLANAVDQNCFVEGTVVATANGPKPIEEIQVGDLVWSVNEWTGEQVLGEVAATFTREVESVWVLEFGGERIETTDEHPFFIHGKGYVAVAALEVGDEVLDAQGRLRRIDLVDRQERSARVYNFEVRGQGNYFVGDGEVLVHNCNLLPARFIDIGGTIIDRASIRTTVSVQRQGRHIPGAREYGGGSYFSSINDAQRVLDDFHSGAAEILGIKGNDIVVRTSNVTGFNHNPGAGYPNQRTNVFFIKGSSSPSVVPSNPQWTP